MIRMFIIDAQTATNIYVFYNNIAVIKPLLNFIYSVTKRSKLSISQICDQYENEVRLM